MCKNHRGFCEDEEFIVFLCVKKRGSYGDEKFLVLLCVKTIVVSVKMRNFLYFCV